MKKALILGVLLLVLLSMLFSCTTTPPSPPDTDPVTTAGDTTADPGNETTTADPSESTTTPIDTPVVPDTPEAPGTPTKKPGLNSANSQTTPYGFEAKDNSAFLAQISGTHAAKVVTNPLINDANPSKTVLVQSVKSSSNSFPVLKYGMGGIEAKRPIYVSFKYLKTYTPAQSEAPNVSYTNLWISKNGSSSNRNHTCKDFVLDEWKQVSQLIDFSNSQDAVWDIGLLAQLNGNPGTMNLHYDDIVIIPSYKLTYNANDGADTVAKEIYFLLDDNGNILTSYSPDLSVQAPARPGYKLLGWSLNKNSEVADAPATIALNNEDITLYAVWGIDENSSVVVLAGVGIDATANTISTADGTVTLTPYLRYSNGNKVTAGSIVTDSVNALAKKNADGTFTLTAKLNGTVKVTAYFAETDKTADVTINITGQTDRQAATNLKLMTFGNSIMHHAPAPDLGWSGSWGMAASSADKDYVHRLIYYIEAKYGAGSVTYKSGGNVSTFERAFAKDDVSFDYTSYITPFINEARSFNPDIITIQIGENVNTAPTAASYKHAIVQFVTELKKAAPDATIVLCTSFWAGDDKVAGATAAAEELGIGLAKLHTLNTDENKAIGQFANSGVAAHPGDVGMDNIAKLLFAEVNKVFSLNEKTVFTEHPTSAQITSPSNSITTPNGTLQLSATVSPADAAQDVVWSVSNTSIATISENGLLTAITNGKVTVTATSRYNASIKASIEITVSGQGPVFTVTYDKNTTDSVSSMPAPNASAGAGFVFDAVYPVRETYCFLGWSLTPNGEVIEALDVTTNITVYAKWAIADSWHFERDGYAEGIVIENGFNQLINDGKFFAIATGTDASTGNVLKVVSPTLALNAADYKELKLTLQNTEFNASTVISLTLKTTNGNVVLTKSVSNANMNAYTFSLDSLSGTILGFEFTPTNVDCTVCLESIEFVK